MSEGVIICLIPDSTYSTARPEVVDPHLTLGYFGKSSEMHPSAPKRLRASVDLIAQFAGPISAKANGLGVFDYSPGCVIVDLIDSSKLMGLYTQLANAYRINTPVQMDRTHGFTPHISRTLMPSCEFHLTSDLEVVEFTFTAVGLWYGDERYEVELR